MDLSESQREDKPEGPTLQTMPSEQIRTYLINTFKVLSKSANIINPEANKVIIINYGANLIYLFKKNMYCITSSVRFNKIISSLKT